MLDGCRAEALLPSPFLLSQQQQQADQKKQHGRHMLDDGANTPETQGAINTLQFSDSFQKSKEWPTHSWTNIKSGSKGVVRLRKGPASNLWKGVCVSCLPPDEVLPIPTFPQTEDYPQVESQVVRSEQKLNQQQKARDFSHPRGIRCALAPSARLG